MLLLLRLLQEAMSTIPDRVERLPVFDGNLCDDCDSRKAGLVLVDWMSKPLL